MPRSDDTARLIVEARQGSSEALGRLFARSRSYLLHIASAGLGVGLRGKVDAADVVQETFLEAQRDFRHFHGGTEPELMAWLKHHLRFRLLKCVRSYCGTVKRSAGREVPLDQGVASSRCPVGVMIADEEPSPSEVFLAAERDLRIQGAIACLPHESRRVIELRYQEDLTFEEIGHILGRTTNASRKLWVRTIRKLVAILDDPSA